MNLYKELLCTKGARVLPRQAPRPFLVLLAAMETYLLDSSRPIFLRVHCWWKLVQCWDVLRHADHRRFIPRDPALFLDGSLRATLVRSKTTGPDKLVKSRPVFISSCSWIMHHAWLTIGWEAMLNMAPGELTHQDASAASLRILSVLGDPLCRSTGLLLHQRVAEAYWREHSGRSFLPSAAACLNGHASSDIDLVGYWRAKAGSLYVRTVRNRVFKVQSGVRRSIQNGSGSIALDEEESLQDLEGWMLKQGLAQDIASSQLLLLTCHVPFCRFLQQ